MELLNKFILLKSLQYFCNFAAARQQRVSEKHCFRAGHPTSSFDFGHSTSDFGPYFNKRAANSQSFCEKTRANNKALK